MTRFRSRAARFALAKWDTPLTPFVDVVRGALDPIERTAPFDLLRFPADSAARFVDDRGQIRLTHGDLE